MENYRPISLLPIFGKIFEKIIFDRLYNFLLQVELLNPNQSGFRPSDSCVNQLIAITHEIFKAFDCNPSLKVRSVFLDISKAFDKVWHEGLPYKLKSMGFSGELYNLLQNYLSDRFQRVLLNGQASSWRPVLAGVPQGSIRPLVDYGDIIYDQPQNESFCEKIESVQYRAALAITGAIQGTSCDKPYHELGLESLKSKRWYKRLSCMFKIMKREAPNYLINLISRCEQTIRTRNNHIPNYHCRTDCFKHSFFPSTLNDWFKLDNNIRNSESIEIFKSKLLSFIRPV